MFNNNFEDLTRIPRESNHEKQVSDHLVQFAKEHGLEAIQESCLNVIVKKPATIGYENAPTIILQGHMDMVCIKTEESNHDFSKDALPILIDGNFIKTRGTTLGADNGIAVAMAMALLADDQAEHPNLEVLLTIAEETGMDGASLINGENLKGTILL
jgi:dipeptidase D